VKYTPPLRPLRNCDNSAIRWKACAKRVIGTRCARGPRWQMTECHCCRSLNGCSSLGGPGVVRSRKCPLRGLTAPDVDPCSKAIPYRLPGRADSVLDLGSTLCPADRFPLGALLARSGNACVDPPREGAESPPHPRSAGTTADGLCFYTPTFLRYPGNERRSVLTRCCLIAVALSPAIFAAGRSRCGDHNLANSRTSKCSARTRLQRRS